MIRLTWLAIIALATQCSGLALVQRSIMATEQQFEQWAQTRGIVAPKLEHSVFGALRGLKVTENIAPQETLVTIPREATLYLKANDDKCPFPSWVAPAFWTIAPWYTKLALKLLWERQLGQASPISGYVELLPAPASFSTLIHWSDQELDALQYPSLQAAVKRQKKAWEDLHSQLRAMSPEGAGKVSQERFIWAIECVLSRSFSGRFGSSDNTKLLLAGAILAGVGGGLLAATDQPWALLAAIAVLLPSTVNEVVAALSKGGESDYVLIPYIDSMNHCSSVGTDLSFDPVADKFSIATDTKLVAGDQAFISYGEKDNDELLQFFGFVEENNPFDVYSVGGLESADTASILCSRRGDEIVDASVKKRCQAELSRIESYSSKSSQGNEGIAALAATFRDEKMQMLRACLQSTKAL
ncbi:unnamed protein product [Chrysoparadoxa australica]